MSETIVIREVETEVVEIRDPGLQGPPGADGAAGQGVPTGGTTGQVLKKASNADFDTEWDDETGGSGTDDQTAAEVPFTPAGNLSSTNVQDALEELDAEKAAVSHSHSGADITSGTVAEARIDAAIARDSEVTAAIAALSTVYQPLDSDLTSIAALATTSFGRGLLELANSAALLSAAGAAAASHAHAGEDITSGTVADDRIASTIARDSEVSAAISALSSVYQPLDSDLTAIAALSTTSFGRDLLTLANAAALLSAAGAAAASHGHDADEIAVADSGGNYTATDVEGVLAEIAPQLVNPVSRLLIGADGNGQVLQTGHFLDFVVPYDMEIMGWQLLADVSGSVVLDLWKDSYGNFPPTNADSVTGSAKPTISGSDKAQSSTLTGWTTTWLAGELVRVAVDSAATIKRVTLSLTHERI